MTITSSGASDRTPAGEALGPELTERHRSDLTANSDHTGMRYEAVRPDTWTGRSPGERQYRTGWSYLTSGRSDATGQILGAVSELGLEFVDLVHPVLELGVCRVFADAAHGPAQDLGAAVRDARGDQRIHCGQVSGPEPRHHGGQLL